MAEIDALVQNYSHLKSFPREKDALHVLRRIASLVKPIMRARGWRVGTLAEFWPDQQNLLGINQNRGQKICLRLRYPGDKNQFMPVEDVVDTMLHELAHNVFGPHNEAFHALWDQLRNEHEALVRKGYNGEGFLSDGRQLGGRRMPHDEAKRIARAAAEKRRAQNALSAGSGQRLGGAPLRAGSDIRRVIADAASRRNTVLSGCGSINKNAKEIDALTEQAIRNGFHTKAEEDKANEEAIAQALWELVQEDQKQTYGENYIASTPQNPTGNGGAAANSLKREPPNSRSPPPRTRPPPGHTSRLVTESDKKPNKRPIPKTADEILHPTKDSPSQSRPAASPAAPAQPEETAPTGWNCPDCTFHNPLNYLQCEMCERIRPEEVAREIAKQAQRRAPKPMPKPIATPAKTWQCTRCTTIMEDKYWACATCGDIKKSS